MKNRFYISNEEINTREKTAELTKDQFRHASKVLRLTDGDDIEFINGEGKVFFSSIVDKKADSFLLKINEVKEYDKPYNLKVYIGLPKGQKMNLITRALTEIGVNTIGLYPSRYSVSKDIGFEKIKRLKRTATEALKQSGRLWAPEIEVLSSFEELASIVEKSDKTLVFHEKATNYLPLSSMCSKNLAVVIGPEGGLAESEVKKLSDCRAILARLSEAVLRVETAAITAAHLARYGQIIKDKN